MIITQSNKTIIENLLEDIFFDSEELELLKREIKQVSLGNLDPIALKKTILKCRNRFKEEMIRDFLPYYKDLMKIYKSQPSELLNKIKEREDLLEIIAIRINNLYRKLEEKKEPKHSNYMQDLSQISEETSLLKKNDLNIEEEKAMLAVDLTNILNLDRDDNGKVKIENVLNLYDALLELGYKPHMIADASMRHYLDYEDQYEDLKEKKIIRQSPAGTKADEWVLEVAKREHCKFLSNDLYRDYRDEFGKDWIFNNRLTSIFANGKFIIRENKNNH